MKLPGRNDTLSEALADWLLNPTRDPNFRAAVWAKIGAARRGLTWTGYARAHLPVLAGALVMALLLGGWAGREQARAAVEANRAEIARAYVETLDARAMWQR